MSMTSIEFPKGAHNLYRIFKDTEFGTMAPGEMFLADGNLLLKTEAAEQVDGPPINAIDLETGELAVFNQEDRVALLKIV